MPDNESMKNLNAMPVNVRAREILEESDIKPIDTSLYCVQVALWALSGDLVAMETDVAETLNAMMSWKPQRIVNFLLLMYVNEYDPPGWKEAPDITDFAEVIIDDVEQKMITHFPYYRSPES